MCLVVKFKLVVEPTARWNLEGHSTTSVKASRRCQTAIISQSTRSVRSPERQNRANHTFQEGRSRKGETFNATFTSSTSLKHVGQSSNESVCKQAPIHSWVPTDSTLSHFLSVHEHIFAALQRCGITEQKLINNLPNPASYSALLRLWILPEESLLCDTV